MTAATVGSRRPSRRTRPVDLDVFTPLIDAAMAAFAEDVSYAAAMARAAVVIGRKRRVWQARKERYSAPTGDEGRGGQSMR